ncbi:thermophilic B-1,4-xylanase from Chaetomium Thermophilum [Clohesyomyces aquaticus]|uniref:Endo-1,4-beta-xylanase n=1 Tax=Clohesyomyces aquaticus TaxID=1231657 RepID=A0A1Y1YYD3_9PLEO|nr:thermophilic B-1,4-xylanase from Chaetomium Thermophilum [Clohesyomyces aquaticus]
MSSALLIILIAVAVVFGTPTENTKNGLAPREELSSGATFFNSFWSDGKSKVSYKNLAGGKYSVTWGEGGNFVGGKGWNPGTTSKVVNFTASFNPEGYAYLTIYGWTTSPLIEFYIVESYHPSHIPGTTTDPADKGAELGNFTSDDGLYSVRTKMRINKPSIQGTTTFRQIFSVREDVREEGILTFANHWKAWKDMGITMGKMNYMIMATEGNDSSGNSTVEIF